MRLSHGFPDSFPLVYDSCYEISFLLPSHFTPLGFWNLRNGGGVKSSSIPITKQEDRLRIEVNGTLFTEYHLSKEKNDFFLFFIPSLDQAKYR